MQRFARKVRAMREPFLIVAGYGQIGRVVSETLDVQGRRLVVVDADGAQLDTLAGGRLSVDVPAIEGDARNPQILGLAGLGHPYCEGILALTNDDHVNLQIVMAVQLLRPEVPVIARSNARSTVGDARLPGRRGDQPLRPLRQLPAAADAEAGDLPAHHVADEQ